MVVPKKEAKKKRSKKKGISRAKRRTGIEKLKPKRTAEIRAWIRQELKEQDARYAKIVDEMDGIAPERAKWIREFFERIQTRGFALHAGIRRKVKRSELPKRPKRKLRVVY